MKQEALEETVEWSEGNSKINFDYFIKFILFIYLDLVHRFLQNKSYNYSDLFSDA